MVNVSAKAAISIKAVKTLADIPVNFFVSIADLLYPKAAGFVNAGRQCLCGGL